MSDVVENRVVEMQFDNKDFETHAAQSIRTLDDLDKALEFKNSSKGFEGIQNGIKNLDFSGLHDNISSIDNAFTSLAGSIERNFLDRISNGILDLGEKLLSSTIGQIMTGGKRRAINIEQAQFKIKGLGKEWDDVKDDIDYAVSGTAYGLDSAASAAAQFLASGVKEGEDMKAALRGISGVAAMTSSDYESISRVFTAAAGKGRVMAIELNRLSLRGVNAAAAIGKYLGVTEAEVRKLASNGDIDFQTFANAMDSAFGEHAKKANQTFTGSLSNIKAALSRIGEIFYEPWIRNMIPVNNAIRESLNKIINVLKNKVYPIAGKLTAFKDLVADLNFMASRFVQEYIKSLDPLLSRLPYRLEHVVNGMAGIKEFMKSGVNTLKTLNNMMENPWDFDVTLSKRLLKSNKAITNEEWKMAREMVKAKQYDENYQIEADSKQLELIKAKGMSLEHIQEIVNTLTGKEKKYLEGITQAEINYANKVKNSGKYDSKKGIIYNKEMKAEMDELGLDAQRVQRYLDKMTTGENKDVQRLFGHERAAKILLYLYEESHKAILGATLLLKKLQRVGVAVVNGFKQIRKDFASVHEDGFPSIMDFINGLLKKFVIADKRYKAIKQIAKGMYSIFELIIFGVKKAFTAISEIADDTTTSGPFILQFFAKFGEYFEKLAKAVILGEGEVPSIIDTLKDAFGGLFESLKKLFDKEGSVRTFFKSFSTHIKNAVSSIWGVLKKVLGIEGEKKDKGSIFDLIISLFKPKDSTMEAAGNSMQKFTSKLGDIFYNLLGFAEHLTENLGDVFDWVWNILQGQGNNISDLLSALFGFFTKLLNGELKSDTLNAIKDMVIAMAQAIQAVFETIRDVVTAIKDPVIQLCSSIAEILASFSNAISSVLGWITSDPEAAYGAAAFFAIIDLIAKGLDNKNRKKGLVKIKELPTVIKAFFTSIADSVRIAVTETPLDKMQKFAKSLLYLSASVFILMAAFTNMYGMGYGKDGQHTNESNTDGVIAAITTLATFMVTIIVLMKWLTKLGSATQNISTAFITVLITQMSSAILKISIGFAIIAMVVKKVGYENAKMTATIIIGILALFMVTVFIITQNLTTLNGTASTSKKMFQGIAAIIAAMGLAISMIGTTFIKLMIAFAGLKLMTGSTNESMRIMLAMFVMIAAIMGILMLTLVVISHAADNFAKLNFKGMLGIAVVLAVFGMVVKSITKSMLKMAAFLALTDGVDYLVISLGVIAAILLVVIGVIALLGHISKQGSGTDMLKAALGLAAVFVTISILLQTAANMAIMFKLAGVTDEDMWRIIALIGTLGVLVALIMAGSYFMGGVGASAFLMIAVGILAIAAAVRLMAGAMWVVIKSFIALALVWPTIKDIIPTMLEDLKTQLPLFIEVIGESFRAFLKEILQSAPLIAAVIVEVAVLVAALMAQKGPLIVGKFLLALDEMVTLLLVGSAVILPKLLALMLIFLGYIDANAVILGEKLTSILLKVIFGAAMAIGHFFDDFLPKYVEENFDKLNTGIVKYLSENSKFYDALGDTIYAIFNGGHDVDSDIAKLAGNYMIEVDGHMVWVDKNGNPLGEDGSHVTDKEQYDKMMDQAKDEAKENMDKPVEVDVEAEAEIKPKEVSAKELLDYTGMDKDTTDAIKSDIDDAVTKQAEETKKTQVKSEGEAGEEAANKYSESFGFTLSNAGESAGITSFFNNLVGKSGEQGEEAGNAFGASFTNAFSNFDMGGVDIGSFTGFGQYNDATNVADMYGDGNLVAGTPVNWEPDINERTGMATYSDINDMSFVGEGQTTTGALGIDAATGNDNGGTMSMLSQLKKLIKDVGDKLNGTVILSKDSDINITTTIDKNVLGKTITPVVNAINDQAYSMQEQKMAAGKR